MKNQRMLAGLLAALMLAGCGNTSVEESKAQTDAAVVETKEQAEITRENMPDTLPADLDFGGKTVTILHRGADRDVQVEINAEDTGDAVDSSIFNRNILVEDRLNVKFDYVTTNDEVHAGTEVNALIQAAVVAGDPTYDFAGNHMSQTTPLILSNHFYNLNNLPYLDFDMPWWNQSFSRHISLHDKLYTAVGDLSQTMLRGSYVTFCNMKLLKDYYGDYNIFDTVRAGEWTMDEFMRLADMYHDVNGDSKADYDDVYGVVRDAVGLISDALLGSTQVNLITTKDSSVPELAFQDERTYTYTEKTKKLLFENNYCWKEDYTTLTGKLVNDTAMLCIYRLSLSESMRDMESDYAILPCPKLDETQSTYSGFTHNGFSVFVIPLSAGDPELSAAVLEALCAESYRSCTMSYYQTTVKEKLARDENVADMIDLIYNGIRFDFGYVYSASLNNLILVFRSDINQKSTSNAASTLAGITEVTQSKLDAILEAYEALE